jgi:hypothetical protein
MTTSIMAKLSAHRNASTHVATVRVADVPMTTAQATALNTKLQGENRVNVHANRKDINTPYRVQMVVGGKYERPQGYFKNIETASLVGTLVAVSRFGERAIVGHFDEIKAMQDEELHVWLNRPANAKVKADTADLFDNKPF